MPHSNILPADCVKVSYILPRADKLKLARIAKKQGVSMSQVISGALAKVLKSEQGSTKGKRP